MMTGKAIVLNQIVDVAKLNMYETKGGQDDGNRLIKLMQLKTFLCIEELETSMIVWVILNIISKVVRMNGTMLIRKCSKSNRNAYIELI